MTWLLLLFVGLMVSSPLCLWWDWHPERRPEWLREAYPVLDALRSPSALPITMVGWFGCLIFLAIWLADDLGLTTLADALILVSIVGAVVCFGLALTTEWFGRPSRLIPPDRRRPSRARRRPPG